MTRLAHQMWTRTSVAEAASASVYLRPGTVQSPKCLQIPAFERDNGPKPGP